MENQKIDDKINNSSVMVLMENDEPLRDAGQASIHAYITSTVMVTTEESDNSVDLVDVARRPRIAFFLLFWARLYLFSLKIASFFALL